MLDALVRPAIFTWIDFGILVPGIKQKYRRKLRTLTVTFDLRASMRVAKPRRCDQSNAICLVVEQYGKKGQEDDPARRKTVPLNQLPAYEHSERWM